MKLVILGLSITSSWGNGHATTYRGLMREISRRGHEVLFLERDQPWYAEHRDLPLPPYGRTELYSSLPDLQDRFLEEVRGADVVIVGSYVTEGAAVGDWVLRNARGLKAFYDIDTPVTLAALAAKRCDYLSRAQVPKYDLYLSFTGGPTLEVLERQWGSPCAKALYCSVDPELHFPEARPRRWDLGYLGTYSADRQPTLDSFLIAPAREDPRLRMAIAGAQYPKELIWPKNVQRISHLAPHAHREFYNAQRFTLNVTREAMIQAGYSPSVRLFEAAACATPVITDAWDGIETLFEPGREILVARTQRDVERALHELGEDEAKRIGHHAKARVLREHTSARRALELEGYLGALGLNVEGRPSRQRRPPRRAVIGET